MNLRVKSVNHSSFVRRAAETRKNSQVAREVPTVAFYAALFGGILAGGLGAAAIYWIR